MNTNGHTTREPNVAASFSGLAHDAIELTELQAQLLVMDAKAASRAARTSAILGIVATCLLLGAVPVMLLAIGETLAAVFDWPRWVAMSVAAVIGLLLSGAAGAAAWFRLWSGLASFKRSREELSHNIAWIKANLKRNKPQSFSERQQPLKF